MRIDAQPSAAGNLRKTDLFPEELHCIGLAAPAGRVAPERYQAACRFLSGLGIKAIPGRSVLKGDVLPYVSAPAADRADDLNELIRDPEVQAVYCLRGGYGSVHLLDRLDWETLKQRRLPVVGYSDITGLHLAPHGSRSEIDQDHVPGMYHGKSVRDHLISPTKDYQLKGQSQW